MRNIAIMISDILPGEYLADISVFDPNICLFSWMKLVVNDGIQSVDMGIYGLRGITPVQHQLFVHGKHLSGIGVLSTRGMEDIYLVEGNVNGSIFIHNCLLGIIQPFNGSNYRSVVVFVSNC